AVVRQAGAAHVVADTGSGFETLETNARVIRAAIDAADGVAVPLEQDIARAALRRVERWLAQRRGAAAIDLRAAAAARARRDALTRVARALARAPRHRRAGLVPLAGLARAVATAPLAEDAERVLDTLVRADLPVEAW